MEDRDDQTDEPDGPERPLKPTVDPGSPTAENTLFVLLGALSTLLVVLRLAGVV